MQQQEKNIIDIIKTEDGKKHAYVIGNTTSDVPFLSETRSGLLVTPFFLKDTKDNLGCIGNKAFIIDGGKKKEYEIPQLDQRLRPRLPTVAINLDNHKIEKLLLDYPDLSSLSITKRPQDSTIFLPMVGFEPQALVLYKDTMKGDLISALGEIKMTTVSDYCRILALWLKDVRFVKRATRNIDSSSIDEEE